nr:V-type ATP synthase subunit E family protein [uncultured Treponema sp.]
MEELRSTDVLDREIRADSEKKASEILSRAEENAKSILSEVQERILKAKEEVDAASKKRLGVLEKNLNASLPLEKQRYLVSFINDSIVDAMKNHIENLDSSKKEQLIENLAKKAKAVTGDAKVTAIATGNMTKASAEKILKNVYGTSCLKVEENHKHDDDDLLAYGIILSTENRKITCRLTLEEKTNEILSQKREQLALALFGGRLPE